MIPNSEVVYGKSMKILILVHNFIFYKQMQFHNISINISCYHYYLLLAVYTFLIYLNQIVIIFFNRLFIELFKKINVLDLYIYFKNRPDQRPNRPIILISRSTTVTSSTCFLLVFLLYIKVFVFRLK